MVEMGPLPRFQYPRGGELKRWFPALLSSHKTLQCNVDCSVRVGAFVAVECGGRLVGDFLGAPGWTIPKFRPVAFNLMDFGGVGDSVTLNMEAFERVVSAIAKLGKKGGGQLNVPPRKWLMAPFNLIRLLTSRARILYSC